MRIKRSLAAAAVMLSLCMVLTGCASSLKITRVATKFGDTMKQQPVTSATAEISCQVKTSGTDSELEGETRFRTVVHSRMDWSAGRNYSDIVTSMNVLGQELSQTLQAYGTAEEGKSVRYIHVDSADLWLRQSNKKSIIDVDPALVILLLDKVSEGTTMEVRENQNGGNTHYVLSLCFTAEDIRDFVQTAGLPISDDLAGCDLAGVMIPLEIEIEDKTFLPIRVQARLQGISDPLMNALARSFGRDIDDLQVKLGDISLLITNFGYGTQEVPMLPMGAAEKALDMDILRDLQK